MFRIRREHAEVFSAAHYRGFKDRMARHLREHFPAETRTLSEEQMDAFIEECVQRAGVYGLESEQAVVCYAHLRLLLGDDFETNPYWAFARVALESDQASPNDKAKIAMLMAYELKDRGY
ncbi:MAG: hypothetical protein ACM3JD_19530 [Rudaea sp.]